ncbi:hypothetical protein Nocox_18950 [Nonomuraea coxensis DSM 45129]|uniref:Plectin n=1 Tax=Nonomuraea coxensis DSM 45129 TaxID=1122611 RepID=A0ABX8U3S2_9ACTN|nr:hypothetical protein [Nonomuraea coxensis]QYC41399.1 hypothetical protein Nocox_18950 [Nonomuraea coxensis DSM 45129]
MAFFRPRVSREAEVRYHADREISRSYPELLERARQAERTLRELRAAAADEIELLAAGRAFDHALTEALRAAEAGRRATFGVKSYDDRIARRKARATPRGREWTAEVDRLRTLREENRLWGIPRVPRPVPATQ